MLPYRTSSSPRSEGFLHVFDRLYADIGAMRAQCMETSYNHDHKVWHDLHDLERTLFRAEEKMSELSNQLIPPQMT